MRKANHISNEYLGKRSETDQAERPLGFQNSISFGAIPSEAYFPVQHCCNGSTKLIESKIGKPQVLQIQQQAGTEIKTEEPMSPRKSSLSTDDNSNRDLDSNQDLDSNRDLGDFSAAQDKKRVNWSALNVYFFIFVVYNYRHLSKKEPAVPFGKRKSRQDSAFYNELLVYLERKTLEIRLCFDPLFGQREEREGLHYDEDGKRWELYDELGAFVDDPTRLCEILKKKKEVLYTRFDKREEESYEFAKRAQAAKSRGQLSFDEPDHVSSVPQGVEEMLRVFLEKEFGSKFSKHKHMLDTSSIWDPNYDMRSRTYLATKITEKVYDFLQKITPPFPPTEEKHEPKSGTRKKSQIKRSPTQSFGMEAESMSTPPSLFLKVAEESNPIKVEEFEKSCSAILEQHQMEMGELQRLTNTVIQNFGSLDNQSNIIVLHLISQASEHVLRMCQDELILANFFVMFVRLRRIRNNKFTNPDLLYM